MGVTEPGAGEPVHHEVDEVVRQELVHACLLFRLVSNISQLIYDVDSENDDIDGEEDDNCTRRVEPVWRADKYRSNRAPPGFDIVIMCNIANLLVFGTLVFDTIMIFIRSYLVKSNHRLNVETFGSEHSSGQL